MLLRFAAATLVGVTLLVTPGNAAQGRSTPKASDAAARKHERFQVAAGTALLVKLQTSLDSATASVDQQVDAVLWSPVVQDGVELIPTGSMLFGRVAAVERATERVPLGSLTIAFSIVEHAETGDRATVRTRNIVVEAAAPPPPPGKKKVKLRPTEAAVAEGAPLVAVTAEPLVVRIPR